ncbi:MAG: hypothetical protein ACUVWO_02055 [Thermodesulfobacteriota bacterium]
MGSFLRPVTIVLELALLTGALYAFLIGFRFTLFDIGLDRKYQRFVRISLFIIGGLVLSFLVAHLITFYPHLWTFMPDRG